MTIREVARLAGVSPAAVSRYLNGGPVSEEKKERIRAVIDKTGFQPNSMARTMRTGQGNQIGLITPRLDSESTAAILDGASERLQESGYGIMLGVSGRRGEQEVRCIGSMQIQQVAGIILMGTSMTPALRSAIEESAKPIVVTGQNFEGCSCVYHDDYEAMRDLMGRMLAAGRRQVTYIGVYEEDEAAGLARRRGAEAAWRERFGKDRPFERVTADGFQAEDGRCGMEELLQRVPDLDGVICASDQIAIGAMAAIRSAGRKMPEEVAVAGVGDSWADVAAVPALTTVHLFYRRCGREAAGLLLEQIRTPETAQEQHIRLGYEIIERASL